MGACIPGWEWCFNEAAPKRGAKGGPRRTAGIATDCFNKAAPKRGRKGRCDSAMVRGAVSMASMRPPPNGAEGGRRDLHPDSPRDADLVAPKRGRKGAIRRSKGPLSTCFNEAAPKRGRKAADRGGRFAEEDASMRPPPNGGGRPKPLPRRFNEAAPKRGRKARSIWNRR